VTDLNAETSHYIFLAIDSISFFGTYCPKILSFFHLIFLAMSDLFTQVIHCFGG
jgi:hypothetical protein